MSVDGMDLFSMCCHDCGPSVSQWEKVNNVLLQMRNECTSCPSLLGYFNQISNLINIYLFISTLTSLWSQRYFAHSKTAMCKMSWCSDQFSLKYSETKFIEYQIGTSVRTGPELGRYWYRCESVVHGIAKKYMYAQNYHVLLIKCHR